MQRGFTLIELSVVLVVISLIIGGILTGQELIRSAQIRATLAQMEKFNTASNTFANKFNGIPGDLQETLAAKFNIKPIMSSPDFCAANCLGFGNGDGFIQIGGTPAGETLAFWAQLSNTGLISGNYGQDIGFNGVESTDKPANYFPATTLGPNIYFIIGSSSGSYSGYGSTAGNFYGLTGVPGMYGLVNSDSGAYYSLSNNITPLQASYIDTKIDDGVPVTGTVRATDASGGDIFSIFVAPKWAATATSGKCTFGGTSATDATSKYNIAILSGGYKMSCSMTISAQF